MSFLDLEAHRRAEPTPGQLLLQCGEQVLRVVLLDLEVFVASDPERVVLAHLHAREELVEVGRDEVLQRHEPSVVQVGVGWVVVGVDLEEPRQDVGHLDAGEVGRLGFGVLQHDGKVEREPGDVGERVRGVNRQRRQHREDPLPEQPVQRGPLEVGQVVPPHDGDALVDQRRLHLGGEGVGIEPHERLRAVGDLLQQLARLQAAGRPHGHAGRDAALESSDADHEELVEVGREDRQEPGSLEQRQGLVHRHLQDALVELQPGQLALAIPVGRQTG
jgi:hypothetical protein